MYVLFLAVLTNYILCIMNKVLSHFFRVTCVGSSTISHGPPFCSISLRARIIAFAVVPTPAFRAGFLLNVDGTGSSGPLLVLVLSGGLFLPDESCLPPCPCAFTKMLKIYFKKIDNKQMYCISLRICLFDTMWRVSNTGEGNTLPASKQMCPRENIQNALLFFLNSLYD